MYNYYIVVDNSYYKVYLIKVVKVIILDIIFRIHINYQLELHIYLVKIFIEDFLKVVCIQEIHLEFRTTLYEVI